MIAEGKEFASIDWSKYQWKQTGPDRLGMNPRHIQAVREKMRERIWIWSGSDPLNDEFTAFPVMTDDVAYIREDVARKMAEQAVADAGRSA